MPSDGDYIACPLAGTRAPLTPTHDPFLQGLITAIRELTMELRRATRPMYVYPAPPLFTPYPNWCATTEAHEGHPCGT